MTIDEIHEWHGYSSTDSLLPMCRYCNPRWEDKDEIALDPNYDIDPPVDHATAINYDLAGRQDASHSFKDFRSPAKARKRHRERNERYYSWRAVKPGQLNRPHYTPNHEWGLWYTTALSEAPVATMTKRDLYREAQSYPRPPKLHRSKPWETRPGGNGYRRGGRKHEVQRLRENVDEDMCLEVQYLATGDDSAFDYDFKVFGIMTWFGATVHCEGVLGDDGCGCACYLCHRECDMQQRLEREAAALAIDGEGSDAGWEMLSNPSNSSAPDEEEWDFVEPSSDTDAEDDWILTHRPSTPLQEIEPFSLDESFDEDGYLPYTDAHLLSDLSTGRCRACIAEYLTRARFSQYAHTRLSDIAVLRGMPVSFTDWTRRAAVPFRQLLPFLVECGSNWERAEHFDASAVMRAARGTVAEEYYEMMEPSWWKQHDYGLSRERASYGDIFWMFDVGYE